MLCWLRTSITLTITITWNYLWEGWVKGITIWRIVEADHQLSCHSLPSSLVLHHTPVWLGWSLKRQLLMLIGTVHLERKDIYVLRVDPSPKLAVIRQRRRSSEPAILSLFYLSAVTTGHSGQRKTIIRPPCDRNIIVAKQRRLFNTEQSCAESV